MVSNAGMITGWIGHNAHNGRAFVLVCWLLTLPIKMLRTIVLLKHYDRDLFGGVSPFTVSDLVLINDNVDLQRRDGISSE